MPTMTPTLLAPAPPAPGPEEALLGAMILDPRLTRAVLAVIKAPRFFQSEANGAIFTALVHLHEHQQTGNLIMLADLLRGSAELAAVGGPNYLKRLACAAPSPSAALELAKQIADRHKLRKMDQGD